jgi:putative PIN family toxin of toxin-antitoxin system
MRLVLDTNVVVSGLLWSGAPRQLLDAARDGHAELFTSTALLDELEATLRYPKFQPKITASLLSVERLVDLYGSLATVVRPARIEPTIKADPDDDAVLACAIASRADFIVSGDRHLLDLGRYDELDIVKVAQVLARLTGSVPDGD